MTSSQQVTQAPTLLLFFVSVYSDCLLLLPPPHIKLAFLLDNLTLKGEWEKWSDEQEQGEESWHLVFDCSGSNGAYGRPLHKLVSRILNASGLPVFCNF